MMWLRLSMQCHQMSRRILFEGLLLIIRGITKRRSDMKRALYGTILSVGISMKRSLVLLIGLFVLIGFVPRTEAADSILVGAINPPPPGISYGYAVSGDVWVAIQFGFTKPVQVNSVGVVLNSASGSPSVV